MILTLSSQTMNVISHSAYFEPPDPAVPDCTGRGT
jgi:hypothetical protein